RCSRSGRACILRASPLLVARSVRADVGRSGPRCRDPPRWFRGATARSGRRRDRGRSPGRLAPADRVVDVLGEAYCDGTHAERVDAARGFDTVAGVASPAVFLEPAVEHFFAFSLVALIGF